MNLFYKPAPGVCYRHFSIEQTKEALAHILWNPDKVSSIITRTYSNHKESREIIKDFIASLTANQNYIPVSLLTDSPSKAWEDIRSYLKLRDWIDIIYKWSCFSSPRHATATNQALKWEKA
jgi:hypothetical protein